ncbi:MAG: LysM peptidoglycan-binding domain-containing protein [Planctomycetaceae bacterium]|jgi:hypothetical protein|nr:LysM peptidoglycan-binding domain-containing protein [Planctomycetaceae bacterium]
MSKKEQQNSEINSLDAEFDQIVDDFSASAETLADKTLRNPAQQNNPLANNSTNTADNADPDVFDDNNILRRFASFLSVFPFLYHLAVKGICKSGSVVCSLFRNTKALSKTLSKTLSTVLVSRLVSFFPTRTAVSHENDSNDKKSNDQNKTDEIKRAIGKEESKKIPQAMKSPSNQSVTKTVASGNRVASGNTADHQVNTANRVHRENTNEIDNDNDSEDDGDFGARWLNLSLKAAMVAAVVLLLTGGYFGVKFFLDEAEPILEETQNTQPESSELPELPLPPLPSQDFAASKTASELQPVPQPPLTPQVAAMPEKSSTKLELPQKPNEQQSKKQIGKQTEKPIKKSPEKPVNAQNISAKKESAPTPFQEPEQRVPQFEQEPAKDVAVASNNNIANSKPAIDDPWAALPSATTVNNFSDPAFVPSTVASSAPAATTDFANPLPELPISLEAPTLNEALAEKPAEKSAEKPAEKPAEPLAEKPAEKLIDKPTDALTHTLTDTLTDTLADALTNATPTPTEKPEVASSPLTLSTSTPPTTLPSETSAPELPATPDLTPLAIAKTETPAKAVSITEPDKTTPLTPLKMSPTVADTSTETTSAPFSSIPPISDISGSQTLSIPKSDDNIQTFSTFSQPPSEQSLNIPEQPLSATPSGEFGKAPTPPEMSSPIPSPTVEPFIPVVAAKKEETIPTIPKSGTIQTIADQSAAGFSASALPSTLESSPAIPVDSGTFAQPVAPSAVASPTPATPPTPYTPPTVVQSPTSIPFAQNTPTITKTTIQTTEPVSKSNEQTLEIPKESPSLRLQDSNASAQISVPAILPQHAELAKVEPPLGSQLQSQVREIRNQDSSEPKLRFGSDAHAPTGAVRYHPKSAVQNIADLLPSQPTPTPIDTSDPHSNPLVTLLPTGNPQPDAVESLPPIETAPQPIIASVNPSYRRSLNREVPASVQLESLSAANKPANPAANPAANPVNTIENTTVKTRTNQADQNERRARLFRRIEDEIKRSPTVAEQYTVRANETYLTISDQFFGTSRLFRALAEYNRQKYGTDYKLSEGTVIEIPPVDYLKNNYAEILTRNGQRPAQTTAVSVSSSGLRYIVREDDTVFRIATNQLRDSSRWQEIIEMNSDKLQSPRDLRVGMEIILPAATATQTGYGRR